MLEIAHAKVQSEPKTKEEFLAQVLNTADLNVLRMALYQLTGDPALAAMRVVEVPVRGGVLVGTALAPEHHDEVKRKALAYLMNPPPSVPPIPTSAEGVRLMELFLGRTQTENEERFGLEELAFEEFPRDIGWTKKPSEKTLSEFNVTVIGCGIAGLALGVQLNRLGINYAILERQAGIGGTWWINDYPECRVDVTSYLYQFKFEKRYPWSEHYASRDETLRYLNHIADKYDVRRHVQLRTELISATWNEGEAKWHLRVRGPDGAERTIKSNVVISSTGLFATANEPNIEGLKSFRGKAFHTTRWDHGFDYANKRVALIGNGSTGSQLMPGVAAKAKRLFVFQRTPQWVMPAENYRMKITPEAQWLFQNVPYYWNWFCYYTFATTSRLQDLQRYDREWQKEGGRINARNDKLREILLEYIRTKVGDKPDLYSKLLPSFAPLGRRSVIDNGWYDALRRDNVELVTEKIARFTPQGILTVDGIERDIDLAILATGFKTSKFLWPVKYTGRGGSTLEQLWSKDGPRSYLGITLPGFPNFFICYGPNGQPRAGGYYSWAEIWTRYILRLVTHMIERGAKSIEVKRPVFDDFNRRLDEAMKDIIWQEEAKGSYYINEFGRVGLNVPWDTSEFHGMVAEPNRDDFYIK